MWIYLQKRLTQLWHGTCEDLQRQGNAGALGNGNFREIIKAHPLLPVEEEGRLNDANLRDNFITRVYVYARLEFEGLQEVEETSALRKTVV